MASLLSKALVLRTDVVSFWNFDEQVGWINSVSQTVHDVIGGHNGTLSGANSILGYWPFTKTDFGGSVLFFGSDGVLTVSGTPYAFAKTQPFSLRAQIYRSGDDAPNFTIFSNVGTTGFAFYIGGPFDDSFHQGLTFRFTDGTGEIKVYAPGTPTTPVTWQGAVLFEAVATYDGSGSASGVKIYVNGSAVSTTTLLDTLTGSTTAGATSLTMGTGTKSSGYVYDDAVVFNTALSGADVAALYALATMVPAHTIALSDTNLLNSLSPLNWATVSGVLVTSCVGAYLDLKPNGSDYISLTIDGTAVDGNFPPNSANDGLFQLTAYLDGVLAGQTTLFKYRGSIELLTTGATTARIVITSMNPAIDKWTGSPPINALRITAVGSSVSTLGTPTLDTAHAWLGFGDSITSGEVVHIGDKAYTKLLADHYGYTDARAAYGGEKFTASSAGGNTPAFTSVVPSVFDGSTRLSGGKFSPMPSIVSVNLGTNDGSVSPTTVAAAIAAMRSASNSDTIIIVMPPFGGYANSDIHTGFTTYQSDTPDANTFLVDVSSGLTYETTDGIHPTEAGYVTIFNALTPVLDPIVPNISGPTPQLVSASATPNDDGTLDLAITFDSAVVITDSAALITWLNSNSGTFSGAIDCYAWNIGDMDDEDAFGVNGVSAVSASGNTLTLTADTGSGELMYAAPHSSSRVLLVNVSASFPADGITVGGSALTLAMLAPLPTVAWAGSNRVLALNPAWNQAATGIGPYPISENGMGPYVLSDDSTGLGPWQVTVTSIGPHAMTPEGLGPWIVA